jgi:AcrR family transcriptional regulator
MELMAAHGYRGLSINALLRRARVARSTFYAHFHGKADLLRDNVARLHRLAVDPHLPPEQHLLRFSRAFFEHVHQNRQLYLSLLRDSDRGVAVFGKIRGVLTETALRDLRKMNAGSDPQLIDDAAQFFVGAQWAVMSAWLERKPSLDIETVHARFERLAVPVLASLRQV